MLTAALDGRATFLVAGAVLGVGIYGFALTFKPYESSRVLDPFPVLQSAVVAIQGPVFEPPAAVLPELAAPADTLAPQAPGELAVSLPRTAVASAPRVPAAPPIEAAASGPSTPLEPVAPAPAPRELPPIVIAPENVLVYIHPGYGRDESEPGHGSEEPTDGNPIDPGAGNDGDRAGDDDAGESAEKKNGNGKERRAQKGGPRKSGDE